MILDVASVSVTGLVRKTNQDSIFSAWLNGTGLFVVADGMGGHFRGEIASQIAAREMSGWWRRSQGQIQEMPFYAAVESLEREIGHINAMVAGEYRAMGQIGGTTLCALLVHRGAYAGFNIGDSRMYLYARHKIRQLTIDDVWENLPEVRKLAESVDISGDLRRGRLVKAVGIDTNVSAAIQTNAIEKKMVFFLCSDGVYKYMEEKQLQYMLKKVRKPGDAIVVNELIRRDVFKNGAADNVSMITVLVRED